MVTVTSFEPVEIPHPVVGEVPVETVGFRLRVELDRTSPTVWRIIEVPGDIHLDTFHSLLQAAMGWWNAHLHQFRQGHGWGSPAFVTDFDVAEGDEGINEATVRLDQVIADAGDELGYLYDYGDGWAHTITVEEVLATPPVVPSCLQGERACPPEDVGGVDAFQQVVEWVRNGAPGDAENTVFEPELLKDWLPEDWHPDTFSAAEKNDAMQEAWVSHLRVAPELNQLLAGLPPFSGVIAEDLLADEAWYLHVPGGCLPTPGMLAPFISFLEVIGDGVKLTATKRLTRATLGEYAVASGLAEWWPRALSSEAAVFPVAEVHELARTLGLVYVRHGRLLPTAQARRLGADPAAWVRFLAGKLPLGKNRFDRHAGWVTLLVAGADTDFDLWPEFIFNTLADMGWRTTSGGLQSAPPPHNPTLTLLEILVRGLDESYLADPDTAPGEQALEDGRRAVAAIARQTVLEREQV